MIKKLLTVIIFLPTFVISQHIIKGTFSPADDYNWIILYKVNPTTTDYVKNAEVSEEGSVEIIMDSTLTKGVYKIVYAIPQTDYNFDVIYSGNEDIEFSFSEEKGIEFLESEENKLLTSYTKSMLLINNTLNNFYMKGNKDVSAYNEIINTLKEAQTNFETASKGKMVEHFIKGNAPYIPSGFEDAETYFNNIRNHYLDNIDFNDPILQSSDFLIQRVLNYVFGMNFNPDNPDSFKSNIDAVAKAMETTGLDYQSYLLETIWSQFVQTSNDSMANYLASKYLLPIAQQTNNSDLLEKLTIYKSTAVGNLAPDFEIEVTSDNGEVMKSSLFQIKGYKLYLVLFWSSTCGHCLEELPELQTYLDTLPENSIQVIAIGLEEEPSSWNQEILNYPKFIHVYGKGKWDNSINKSYGVTATPSYFLLDSDKRIISKPYDLKALKIVMAEQTLNKE